MIKTWVEFENEDHFNNLLARRHLFLPWPDGLRWLPFWFEPIISRISNNFYHVNFYFPIQNTAGNFNLKVTEQLTLELIEGWQFPTPILATQATGA